MVEIGWINRYRYSKDGIVADFTPIGLKRIGELHGLLLEISGGTNFQGFEQIFRGFIIAVLLQFNQIPPNSGGDGG